MRSLFSGERRDIALFVAAAMAQRLGPMLVLPFLLAALSLGEYGAFALVLSAVTLLPIILALNIPAVVTRLYFDAPAAERSEQSARLLSGTVATILLLSASAAGAALAGRRAVGELLGVSADQAGWLAIAVIVASMGAAFLQLSYAIWRATKRPLHAVTANTMASLLMVVIVGSYAARRELTLLIAAAAIAGAYLTAGVLSLASLDGWRHWRSAFAARVLIRDAAAKAIPVLGYTLGMWVLTAGGRWIGRMNLTLEDVAQFTVATQVSAVLSLLGRCAYEAWSPVVYSLHTGGDTQAAHDYLVKRVRVCVAAMALGAAVAMAVVWVFIATHATHYAQVISLLPIVLAAPIVDMAHLRHYTNLMAAKQVSAIATYTTASIAVFVVAGFVASAHFGVYGLCVAFLATHLLQWVLAWGFDHQARLARTEAIPARVPAVQ